MEQEEKIFIPVEEAMNVLNESEMIQTFISLGAINIECDMTKEIILEKIKKADNRELTGKLASSKGYGLAIYNDDASFQHEVLFIATDMKKITELKGRK